MHGERRANQGLLDAMQGARTAKHRFVGFYQEPHWVGDLGQSGRLRQVLPEVKAVRAVTNRPGWKGPAWRPPA